jgi:hypothetical protein
MSDGRKIKKSEFRNSELLTVVVVVEKGILVPTAKLTDHNDASIRWLQITIERPLVGVGVDIFFSHGDG